MSDVNHNARYFATIINKWKGAQPSVTRNIAVVGQNFFIKGFALGGQQLGTGVTPWPKRKFETDRNRANRQVLTKRGSLAASIHQKNNSRGKIEIYTEKPYAKLMNDGGTVTITPKMRRFFWAMYFKELGRIRTNKQGAQSIKSGQKVNEIAKIWRNLAMHKGNQLKFQKREFFYDSPVLADQIGKYLVQTISKLTNQ